MYQNYFVTKSAIDESGRQPSTLEKMTEVELQRVNFKSREVRLLLKELQVKKATGPDDISTRVLRECAIEHAPSLSRLFRISLRKFPAGWPQREQHFHLSEISFRIQRRRLRCPSRLRPRSKPAQHACHFLPRVARMWNALPADAFSRDDPEKKQRYLKDFRL